MAAAAIVPGKRCWVSVSGYANKASRLPLNADDEFPIGSITKTFTATVVLQLVQEGKLSLSAPISDWVPSVQDAKLARKEAGIAHSPIVAHPAVSCATISDACGSLLDALRITPIPPATPWSGR
jgi:CubicO group peptidase (beta-lactamase class C family)